MAHYMGLSSIAVFAILAPSAMAITCPGFPGYCSESFPGQTCNVVCARGRNNIPLCQEDGTWTDLPRCVEHDPGTEEQIAGLCPGIPGYCSTSFYDGRCNFKCARGPDINSVCTHDGTWEPYPTCQGDLRETQDGCDGCPGPNGKTRNRTAEALSARQASNLNNRINHNRVPKAGSLDNNNLLSSNGIRKPVPSFAGAQKFGRIQPSRNTPPQFPSQKNTQSPRRPTQQSFNNNQSQRRPTQQSFNNNPRQQFQQSNKGQSLFDQIQNRIKTQKSTSNPRIRTNVVTQRVISSPPTSQPRTTPRPRPQPRPTQRVVPQSIPRQPTQDTPNFGVFESVDLSDKLPTVATRSRQQSFDDVRSSGPSPPSDGFFGVFQEVNLQG